MNAPPDPDRSRTTYRRVALGWIVCLVALGLAGVTGDALQTHFGVTGRLRQGVQALIMSGIALPGIWWLRTRVDGMSLAGLGMADARSSLAFFGKGVGLVIAPMLVTILATLAFGWASIAVDLSSAGLGALMAGIATVLFFEAIPEETVFRGYIYSNLSTIHRRWVAGAITVALFVLLPSVLFPLWKYVLGMDTMVGGSGSLTPDYLIMMVIFGSFVQYLRIQTGSIWTCIGFHAMFVLMNRIMSPRPTSFIRFTEVSNGQGIQTALLGALLLTVMAALTYPRLSRWVAERADRQPDPSPGSG